MRLRSSGRGRLVADGEHRRETTSSAQRKLEVEPIAMVVFLVSPAGRNISGQSLGVDGNVESL